MAGLAVSKPTALAVCGLLLFAPLLMLTLTPKDTAQNAFLDVNAPLWLDFVKRQPAHWTKLFTKPSLTFKSATDDLAKVVEDTGEALYESPGHLWDLATGAWGNAAHRLHALRLSVLDVLQSTWFRLHDQSKGRLQKMLLAAGGVLQSASGHLRALGGKAQDSVLEVYGKTTTGLRPTLDSAYDTTTGLWAKTASAAHTAWMEVLLRLQPHLYIDLITAGWSDFWTWFGPGGKLHPQDFIENKGHLVLEGVLLVVIAYMFFQGSYKWSTKHNKAFTEEEIDTLCEEWQPEPLCPLSNGAAPTQPPIVSSTIGLHITVNGKKGVLNMVSFNFLGAAGDPTIMDACKDTILKYGVGSCGPRGFYGTIDVHLELEDKLANFMGREECIIYSYDLSTVPSVLPAFANAKDLIIVDEGANYAIQNGCHLSRAKVVTFKHNDMDDLERVIKAELEQHRAKRKPLNRRFIVVEGIYAAFGDLAPLERIAQLKHAHKFRLVVDESLSFGVLGEHGRGACEHAGLGPDDAEIVCASLGNALAGIGGFCVGNREVVDHQRLSGLGYCFSASLPPYLATASIKALEILQQQGPELTTRLRNGALLLHSLLSDLDGLQLVSEEGSAVLSPVVHMQLSDAVAGNLPYEGRVHLLQTIVDRALDKSNVFLVLNRISALDKVQREPTIRVAVTAEHGEEHIRQAVDALRRAVQHVCR